MNEFVQSSWARKQLHLLLVGYKGVQEYCLPLNPELTGNPAVWSSAE